MLIDIVLITTLQRKTPTNTDEGVFQKMLNQIKSQLRDEFNLFVYPLTIYFIILHSQFIQSFMNPIHSFLLIF